MWATLPPLISQPTFEVVPDQPSRVSLAGYIRPGQFFAYRLLTVNTSPYVGQPVTLHAALHGIHAVHCVVNVDSESAFSIHLGNRYRLRLQTFLNVDPLHPFLVPSQRGLRASIDDNGTPLTSVDLAYVTPPFTNWTMPFVSRQNAPLNLCVGYAYNNSHELKAYVHLSNQTYLQTGGWFVERFSPVCGSGTASLLVSVEEEDALQGSMKIVVEEPVNPSTAFPFPFGLVSFEAMSCAFGPFLFSLPHVLETTHEKTARAGDRIASLRSKAVNFSTRAPIGTAVALVDCGGHPEFSAASLTISESVGFDRTLPEMFAVSVAGQPDSTTAYVAPSQSWRSNCGFSYAHAIRASAVSVSVVEWDIHPGFPERKVSFDVTNVVADSHGNNEYATTVASQGDFWDLLHVQVRIIGREDVVNPSAAPLPNVQARTRFTVVVSVFGSKDGQRATGFFGFGIGAAARIDLTEEEAVAFFDGQPLELQAASNNPTTLFDKIQVTLVGQ